MTRNVPCLNGRQPRVGPDAVRRFRAVTAVSCIDAFRTYPGQGEWEVHVRRVALGSVSGLQKYFEQHSVTKRPKNLACTANLVIVLVPVFVDAEGRSLVPQTPVDVCDKPLGYPDYGKGSTRVRWHVVSTHRIRQLVSAPALAAHCDMQVKNLMYGWVGPDDTTSGGQLFAEMPKTVRVCVYRTPAADLEVGNFVRGFRLDAARTSRLLGGLTGATPNGSCADQRDFAVVTAGAGSAAAVELGGCWRIARPYPNHGIGGADASIVRSVVGPG